MDLSVNPTVVRLSGKLKILYGVAEFGAVKLGFDGRRQDLQSTVRVGIAALVGWSAVAWLTELGITHVVFHALVLFVLVTAVWAGPLLVLLGRVWRKEPLFVREDT